jgi:tetratricopeptide (TPR) repeat protein
VRRLVEVEAQALGEDRAELLEAALAFIGLGAYGEALAAYERLARIAPDEPAYQAALADLYRRAGRPAEAMAASAKASKKAD